VDSARHDRLRRAVAVHVVDVADPSGGAANTTPFCESLSGPYGTRQRHTRRRGDRSTARRRLEGMFSENFEASPSRGNPGGYPGPMAPHGERAFNGFCRATDRGVHRRIARLVHTYELSIPILLTVWVGEFSTTAAVLGLVVTVGYGLFGVGALPGGILVDRFGSKPLILACLGGMAGSFLLVSLAPNLLTLALAIAVWGSLRASITRRGCRCSRSRSISAGLRSATTGSGEPRDRARPAGDRAPPLSLRLADRHGRAHGTRGRGRRLRSHRRYRRRAS